MEQNQRDLKFRESVSILARLAKYSPSRLDDCAREHGVTIRAINEDVRTYISRLWSCVTGRTDFDLAYSSLILIQSMKGELNPRRTPEIQMRDKIRQQVASHASEIEREENRTDIEFMDLLRQV